MTQLAKSNDKLIITEDTSDEASSMSGSDNEHEDSDNEATTNREETVVFPTVKKQKKVVKKLTKKEQSLKRSLKEYRIQLALVKPDVTTDREKERALRRFATKGVVQLFNAVSDRQKAIDEVGQQKLTAKQRREAREQFKGDNFDVGKFSATSVKKEMKSEDMEIPEEDNEVPDFSD